MQSTTDSASRGRWCCRAGPGRRTPRRITASCRRAPLVEQIIVSTATDLGAPADHQGAGLVNALKAVQLAESIDSASPQGSTLLVNKTSLNATVNAGQSQTFSIGVTNEGSASQTVTPTVSGRPTDGVQ